MSGGQSVDLGGGAVLVVDSGEAAIAEEGTIEICGVVLVLREVFIEQRHAVALIRRVIMTAIVSSEPMTIIKDCKKLRIVEKMDDDSSEFNLNIRSFSEEMAWPMERRIEVIMLSSV